MQETVDQLHHQKAALEPVVKAQRETVEAILAAHATSQRSGIWKDRLIGFVFGILASIIGGLVLAWFGMVPE